MFDYYNNFIPNIINCDGSPTKIVYIRLVIAINAVTARTSSVQHHEVESQSHATPGPGQSHVSPGQSLFSMFLDVLMKML